MGTQGDSRVQDPEVPGGVLAEQVRGRRGVRTPRPVGDETSTHGEPDVCRRLIPRQDLRGCGGTKEVETEVRLNPDPALLLRGNRVQGSLRTLLSVTTGRVLRSLPCGEKVHSQGRETWDTPSCLLLVSRSHRTGVSSVVYTVSVLRSTQKDGGSGHEKGDRNF